MFRPSVCIDAVFEDRLQPQHSSAGDAVDDALALVAAAGISAFEFWGWWDRDLSQLQAAQAKHGLEISACCTKFISLVDPATRDDYLTGLSESIAAAQALGCRTLISQVGDFRPGVPRQTQHDCLVAGLKEAAQLLDSPNVTLVIEPLNELVNHPGYYLVRSDEAFEVVDKVASDRVKVVFDIYHQQVSEGHLIQNISTNMDRIGHFHAAGNPGRHELDIGEINYPQIFDVIHNSNFAGYVGLEYWPVHDPARGLATVSGWFSNR